MIDVLIIFTVVGFIGVLVVFCYQCQTTSSNKSTTGNSSTSANISSTANSSRILNRSRTPNRSRTLNLSRPPNRSRTPSRSRTVLPTAPSLVSFEQPQYVVNFIPHLVVSPPSPNQPEPMYWTTSYQPVRQDTTSDQLVPVYATTSDQSVPVYRVTSDRPVSVYRATSDRPTPVPRATSDRPTSVPRATTSDGQLNRSNAAENPPGYTEVVMGDYNGSYTKFPEVKPTAPPETPPPEYGKENVLRY